MAMFKGRYDEDTETPKRGEGIDYKELATRGPEVVSLTFYRSPNGAAQRLGFRLQKGGDDGGDIRVIDLDGKEDSILQPFLPIQVGDILVAINHQSCYGIEFELLLEAIAKTTGLITLHFRRTDKAPMQDEIRQAIFFRPKEHTCLPMAIDFARQKDGHLTIGTMDPANAWFLSSCLEKDQVILTINGARSFQLEEEDAQLFLQTQTTLAKYISFKTYSPSRIAKVGIEVEVNERARNSFGAWGSNMSSRLGGAGSRKVSTPAEPQQRSQPTMPPSVNFQRFPQTNEDAAEDWRNRCLQDEI